MADKVNFVFKPGEEHCLTHDRHYAAGESCVDCAMDKGKWNAAQASINAAEEALRHKEDVEAHVADEMMEKKVLKQAAEIERLSATVQALERSLAMIEAGDGLVIPSDARHANAMLAVARAYVKGSS